VIDLHTHILPGVDDGARDLVESLRIARACVADGVTAVAATPHVREDYPTRFATISRAVEQLRQALGDAGVDLTVHTGAEVAVDQLRLLGAEELLRLALAGRRYLLVECPYYGWPARLFDELDALGHLGLRPILAHPERNADVASAPELLRPLVDAGVLVQVTAVSVVGALGRSPRQAAHSLLRSELAHLIASDAHSPGLRRAGLAAAAASVKDRALAHWLTVDVPAAVVAGTDPPLRPRPRRLFGRYSERIR
jgi:protein-tyrosine phosphatase